MADVEIQLNDKVTYHGSLKWYHDIEFWVSDLFEFEGVKCATLVSGHMDTWIQRCRVSNLKPV